MDYRWEAMQLLDSAKENLADESAGKLLLVALSLRMAIEALTYERAKLYEVELPSEEYKTWQPRLLMKRLLEIDPYADKGGTISIGEEIVPGQPAESMSFLGKEEVLSFATIKKHYDALGAYLHMPTQQQLEGGKSHDFKKLKARCEEVIAALEKVFSSTISNASFNPTTDIECMKCGKPVKRRFRTDGTPRKVECFECGAQYTIGEDKNKQLVWHPEQTTITCPNKECSVEIHFWKEDVKLGKVWSCPLCEHRYAFRMGIFPDESEKSKKGLDSL